MPLQRHAWPYRNRILSAFFVLSLKRNNTTNENNNSNNDFEKKEKGKKRKRGKKKRGRREGTRGAWTNEPRPSLDPKYVYVREWRDQCALARNCKLEPNARIFDFCGHAKKTFDAIHPNRSTELCSSIDIPLCYCRMIDEKNKTIANTRCDACRDITADKNSTYWNRTGTHCCLYHLHVYLFTFYPLSLVAFSPFVIVVCNLLIQSNQNWRAYDEMEESCCANTGIAPRRTHYEVSD